MRKYLFIAVVMLSSLCGVAQEGMYSFKDYPISTIDIQTDYTYINTFVRKVDVGDKIQYYYVLKAVSKDKHIPIQSFYAIMIPYEDLTKVNNALPLLIAKEENDKITGIEETVYVENKFVTERGFKIGYCIDNGKLEWFVEFDYFAPINGWNMKDRVIDNKTFILNNYNGNEIGEIFGKAQAKIESLMQSE